MLRLTANGALDTTFGSGGSVELPWNSRIGLEVTTERDGRLLVKHFAPVVDAVNPAQLSRLTLAGEIDSSFGSQGTLTLPDRCVNGGAGQLAFQSNGRLVLLCSGTLMRVR